MEKNWQEPGALSAWMTQGLTWKLSLLLLLWQLSTGERVGRTDPRFLKPGRQVEATATSGNTVAGPPHRAPWCWMLGAPVPGDGRAAAPGPYGPQGPCLGLMLFKMTTCVFIHGSPLGPMEGPWMEDRVGLESTELAELPSPLLGMLGATAPLHEPWENLTRSPLEPGSC